VFQVVYVSCKNMTEARKITNVVLEKKLAACVNMIRGIESMYWWEGKVQKDSEVLLIIKTKKTLFKGLSKTIKSIHSYTNPEIISLPIIDGNKDYLKWIDDTCAVKKKKV